MSKLGPDIARSADAVEQAARERAKTEYMHGRDWIWPWGTADGFDHGWDAGAAWREQQRNAKAEQALGVWTPERHSEFLELLVARGNALNACEQQTVAAIVAWLREWGPRSGPSAKYWSGLIADAIERGDWRTVSGEGKDEA